MVGEGGGAPGRDGRPGRLVLGKGQGEARREPLVLSQVFLQLTRLSTSSRSLFPGRTQSCGAPARQKRRPVLPVLGKESSVLQVLESPEDTRTAAAAGAARQGRAGRRCLPRAAAPQTFTETVWKRGLLSLLYPSALLSYPKGWCWCSWGPGLGRSHVTGTPGRNSLA